MSRLQTIIEWTHASRRTSPLFDTDADALLTRLYQLKAQETALQNAQSAPASIALYGHSQAAKAHLLATLCSSGNGRLLLHTGSKTLDYFTHLNPGHAVTRMALRFSHSAQTPDDAFPLRLRIMREVELVQVFLAHALQQGAVRQVEKSVVAARLNAWQSLRQTQPVPGINEEDVAAIAHFWQSNVPAHQQQIDDSLWQQFIQLLPCLDLSARASAWALLWGEQQELTRQWLTLAHVLQQCGNARELAAPLSLLVDSFTLPAEGFLTPESEPEGETVVHPLIDEQLHNAVSLPLNALALLTVELVLPTENGVLDNVDLIDIPHPAQGTDDALWASKCRWLLEHYRQQLQPDLLLICNAAATRAQIPTSARALTRWVSDTQPQHEGALPGLVWAITPQDDRFVRKLNLDEAVQQLIEKPGQRWGTLQALDGSSLQRLIEWLSQATIPALRAARFDRLTERQHQAVRQMMSCWQPAPQTDAASARRQAENVVRELQGHAATLGELLEGLLPPLSTFEQLSQVQQPREEKVSELFSDNVDLFALPDDPQLSGTARQDSGFQAHALWVNYLRQWSRSESNARRYGITPAVLQQLADCLIITSYRLDLPKQLQAVIPDERASAARLRATISNYLAWLGYADMPVDSRPASRVMKGSTLFAPTASNTERLTQLGERPAHAATRYVYDWLVALFTRATEAPEYRHPLDLSPEARAQLNTLL
ncbi:virulence factor SrfC family protein [Scandinavium goeteborgense]|uniref:virulence factor SrfC family protein n=1 Tax=Scandinavium goeteborgense TaxID=1851514 RepID=UPI00216501AA|nr:virulence factor SrfC family protein [Scandinavium goeteborgense]MCS2154126.1 virulence factor SrfC family protein [Scandinavium goeteborgense]